MGKRPPYTKALLQAVLRRDFPSFIAKSFQTLNPGTLYQPNWHIHLIAEYLEAARRGEIRRLIINMPPRSLKSLCASVAWPAWVLANNPAARIMAASYAQPLSLKHSLDCRAVIQSNWYQQTFAGVRLSREQNEKHKFLTSEHGFRFATSVGGVATGEGGNFLIVDDPLNPLQAANRLWRGHVNDWFDHTFTTRLDDPKKGVIVLVMQRLHQDDLSGYLLEKGGWEHLSLPAIAPETRLFQFGKKTHEMTRGELLHPARMGMREYERLKLDMGSHAFSAQYQQMPVPDGGQLVKPHWLMRYGMLPETKRIVQSWDTAIKAGDGHDASVCLTFFEGEDGAYLADAAVMRLDYPDLKRAVSQLAERWEPNAILMEDKASGQQLVQDFRRSSMLPMIPIMPRGDKMTRFCAVTALIEAGKLHLPKNAPWLADFETELLGFPNVKHDDQVDSLTQYLNWVRSRRQSTASLRRL